MAKAEKLILDRCPLGQGYWFDHGELNNVLEQFCATHEETAAVSVFLREMFKNELEKGKRP